MIRTLLIFLGSFAVGATVALAVRTAWFDPHAAASHPSSPPAVHAAPASHTHGEEGKPTANAATPVNTMCAICGMAVNPAIPFAQYRGKTIGFGCKQCPPKFAADPERYGPAYLRNEVVE
jgi:YHS domain-containing protein